MDAFHSIPSEIHCLIFAYAQQASLVVDPHTLTRRPIEMSISHVCSLWRNISLDYAALWDTFRHTIPKSKQIQPAERLKAYLERSRNHLLEIWFNFSGNEYDYWSSEHLMMFEMLLPHQRRWRRITILLARSEPLEKMYKYALKDVSPDHLEHFALLPCDSSHIGRLHRPDHQIFLSGAAKLCSVRLNANSYTTACPPLSLITTLRFESLSDHGIVLRPQALTSSYFDLTALVHLLTLPTLCNASLSGFDVKSDSGGFFDGTIRTKVQDFRCSSRTVADLLLFLDAPFLHTLTLRDVGFHPEVLNSLPSLRNLTLINCHVQWSGFTVAPRLSQKIETLTVVENSNGRFHHDAISELTPTKWPNLRTLGCNIQSMAHIDMYLQLALCRFGIDEPKAGTFTLRIHRNLIEIWTLRASNSIKLLRDICNLEAWDDDSPLLPRQWPYTEEMDIDHVYDKLDHDPFRVPSYY